MEWVTGNLGSWPCCVLCLLESKAEVVSIRLRPPPPPFNIGGGRGQVSAAALSSAPTWSRGWSLSCSCCFPLIAAYPRLWLQLQHCPSLGHEVALVPGTWSGFGSFQPGSSSASDLGLELLLQLLLPDQSGPEPGLSLRESKVGRANGSGVQALEGVGRRKGTRGPNGWWGKVCVDSFLWGREMGGKGPIAGVRPVDFPASFPLPTAATLLHLSSLQWQEGPI